MGLVDPRFDFSFGTISKGYHAVEVVESGIDPQPADKTSGKQYWVRVKVISGGDSEGFTHQERFFEKTKDDFSFSKMAGFLYKIEIIKTLGKVDTAFFLTPEFESRWNQGLKGRKMGGKFRYRYAEADKDRENPYSDWEKYLSYDEVMTVRSKSGSATVKEPPMTVPETPVEKAPWA